MGILVAVLLYEILTIGGVSYYLYLKKKKAPVKQSGDSFVTSDRDLSTIVVGISLALAVLGAIHVFGIMELSWNLGAVSIWFSIAHVILLCVICLATGRWVRRMKVATVPELIDKLYGKKIAIVTTCVIAGQTFAILTLEAQALGIIFHTLTRSSVSIPIGAFIDGVLGIIYVVFAGMKEIALVNVINIVVMYVSLIIAAIFLTGALPGGWYAVESYFIDNNLEYQINIFANREIFMGFGLSLVIAVVFAQGISQMGLSTAMAAKNEKTLIRALWIAAPLNGLFGIFTMAMGLAAKSLVETGQMTVHSYELAPKIAGTTLIMNYLPDWLVALLLATFLGAVISTFALTTMGLGALFAYNVYPLKNPNVTSAHQTKLVHICIVVFGIIACGVSSFLPDIINGANWVFAWLCPIFFITIFGLFWKRSKKVAGIMLASSWIAVMLWTYTPLPVALGIQGIPIPYVTLVVSITLGVILNFVMPGEPAYFKAAGAKKLNIT